MAFLARGSQRLGRALTRPAFRSCLRPGARLGALRTPFSSSSDNKSTLVSASHNENIVWSDALMSAEDRRDLIGAGHRGGTIWITGLSGSGKSTIGAALEQELLEMGIHAYRLDGDNVRFGLNKDLGFSAKDRDENIRRIAEVAALFADSGVVTITSFISPYRETRQLAREVHEKMNLPFIEVHAHVPLDVAEQRDPKGLYKKARAGELKGFTGIDDPYEEPETPEVKLHTHEMSVPGMVGALVSELKSRGVITGTYRLQK
mmetsp:Transcript_9676/g.10940  ORF Transcript_9676/g.10940 Transcript_9676/m.10940 type:complete len:261 (+) Transcript_9676:24-806(+)|eukprot:CAMPEP_0205819344 /NCGR_PEP_ID=MMETSP0206-20130828/1676_1 /ASSEMBLY_ACC=CAM_ASM_000279 /TAXON_ID=36767 /ORGANISM="Euplotes focardii, Strain TN1" /LENGTH=260 /DNA_ID=CAMNT_0053112823 /DNA_START=24 /DNA_END=806 /DNA_ORIENTATION=+